MDPFTWTTALVALMPVLQGASRTPDSSPDSVVTRLHEHSSGETRPLILVVGAREFPATVWKRVQHLVAFRLHRPADDGTTRVDAAIYLVRDSALYQKAAATLRSGTTIHEYVWCLLAAVVAHEAAHTTPETERQALTAEVSQLRRCLAAGHLHATDGWNAGAHLQKTESRLRKPREHY